MYINVIYRLGDSHPGGIQQLGTHEPMPGPLICHPSHLLIRDGYYQRQQIPEGGFPCSGEARSTGRQDCRCGEVTDKDEYSGKE
jgi:hypothetical protein